jgi:acyl-CoA thioesterase I
MMFVNKKAKLKLGFFICYRLDLHMKKIVFIVVLLIVVAFVGVLHQQNTMLRCALVEQGATVLILGDSLSYGNGAKEGEDYPSLLQKYTGWNIVNAGISGNTSAQGLSRLPELLEKHQPKLLIVELGGNDLLRHIPEHEVEDNLQAIIQQAKQQGVPSVLIAIPSASPFKALVGNLSDDPVYEKVSLETKTPLVTEVFSEVLSDSDLKADQIHPNAQGYQQVALKLQAAFHELGYLQ